MKPVTIGIDEKDHIDALTARMNDLRAQTDAVSEELHDYKSALWEQHGPFKRGDTVEIRNPYRDDEKPKRGVVQRILVLQHGAELDAWVYVRPFKKDGELSERLLTEKAERIHKVTK